MSAITETPQLLSTGGAARTLGISVSLLMKYEREGKIPPAMRLVGSDRRVYAANDIEAIRAARGAAQQRREAAAS